MIKTICLAVVASLVAGCATQSTRRFRNVGDSTITSHVVKTKREKTWPMTKWWKGLCSVYSSSSDASPDSLNAFGCVFLSPLIPFFVLGDLPRYSSDHQGLLNVQGRLVDEGGSPISGRELFIRGLTARVINVEGRIFTNEKGEFKTSIPWPVEWWEEENFRVDFRKDPELVAQEYGQGKAAFYSPLAVSIKIRQHGAQIEQGRLLATPRMADIDGMRDQLHLDWSVDSKPSSVFVLQNKVFESKRNRGMSEKEHQQAEANRMEQERAAAAEAKRLEEEKAKEAQRIQRLRENRATAHLKSFEDAAKALSPILKQDDGTDPMSFAAFLRDPLASKGQVFARRFRINQAIGAGQFLMTNYPSMGPMYLGGSMGMVQDVRFMGFVTPSYGGSREFVDDQIVDVIGEVVGTTQYMTALQSLKTVPQVRIYGIRVSRF